MVFTYTTQYVSNNPKLNEKLTNPNHTQSNEKQMDKINRLKQVAFTNNPIQNFAVFNSANITYFSGFQGALALLFQKEENTLYVSQVNYEQAKAETKGFTINCLNRGNNLMEKIAHKANIKQKEKLAVDSLNVESWRNLAKAVGAEEKLELANSFIRDLRLVKDNQELEFIRKACKIAAEGMQAACENIKPGVKERQVVAEAEYAMRSKGSEGTGFDTIVASGPNSAFPHGSTSNRQICDGDLVMVDLGAIVGFYRSDITRTFVVGKPSEKQHKMFDTVINSQQVAVDFLKPDTLACQAYEVARQAIAQAGFGECVHNLGHGVGLEVHEPPTLSPLSKEFLSEGNVLTVEPGVYIPSYGGVRVEDTVLIGTNKAEKLTVAPYKLETK
jgi:Xaa-Pro dipeptidase